MTEKNQNTEDDAVEPKPAKIKKSAAKAKASAKKDEIETTAPYLTPAGQTTSSHSSASKGKFLTSLILLLVVVALILTTIYKYNEERSETPTQAQTNTADVAEQSPVVVEEIILIDEPVMGDEPTLATIVLTTDQEIGDTTTPEMSDQPALSTTEKTDTSAATRAPVATQAQSIAAQSIAQAESSDVSMPQRLQTIEKEIQSLQQQFQELMKARQKSRAEFIASQKAEFQRMKQIQLETRKKAFEVQKKIHDQHMKLGQLMREAHTQDRP